MVPGALLVARLLVSAAMLGAGGPVPAQTPHFESRVQAVEVYASVTDSRGEPIAGLRREQFHVLEDGHPQDVTTFAEGEFRLSVAVAVDRSWSMAGEPLARARHGARTFLDALRPADQAMIVAISGRVEAVAPLATDRAAAIEALSRLDPWSTTALHDAILQAIDLVQAGSGRRALVLLSDGVDRYSESRAADVVAHARGTDVMIYPVALGRTEPPLFAELAALTGGRSFEARDATGLDAAMRAVAADLRHQYLLGYAPSRTAAAEPGAWRSIEVRADVPGARVRARSGYRAD